MCSLTEDVMHENTSSLKNVNYTVCKKCQATDPVIVLRKIDVYCKKCFLAATNHKFRLMLGKYRIVRPGDKVLVVHRIGHPSTALLHFIHEGVNLNHHKKLQFYPVFLFIDENKSNKIDRKNLITNIYKQFTSYNFPLYFTSLKMFMDEESCNYYTYTDYVNIVESTNENIQTGSKKKSGNVDAVDIFRRNFITSLTKLFGCTVAFTPEICIDTAVGILTDVALGRGAQIPLNMGVIDDRCSEVKLFKPLRLFEMKELVYYNFFNDLTSVNVTKVKNSENALNTSVQILMKNFVEGLQINFPSTITTIMRTGDKLSCDGNNNRCKFCLAPIEVQNTLSSCEATDFSKWVSTHHSNDLDEFILENKNFTSCFACSKIF